jgi:hypothetical protein
VRYGADALKKVGFEALIREFKPLGGNLSELIDPVWFGDNRKLPPAFMKKGPNHLKLTKKTEV